MNKTLLRGWNWCRRFRKRCGYGVHSPSDFFFITFVIYERLPFYAYSSLHHQRRLVAHLPGHREKVDKLFFRMINYLRPLTVFEFGTGSGMTVRYMQEANSKMNVYTFSNNIDPQVERLFSSKHNIHYINYNHVEYLDLIKDNDDVSRLFHLAHVSDYQKLYDEIMQYVSDRDFMVISYPYADACKKNWWKKVMNDERTGVIFDLYDIGIIFFDKKRIKENRIVNFL